MSLARTTIVLIVVIAALIGLSSVSLLYYRDNFSTHYPVRFEAASIVKSGELPLWNPTVGGGQPLAGNPNTLTFHPSAALYLFLPPWTAFNLHFLLHMFLAFPAMRALLLALELPRRHATIGGLFYVLSGVAISSMCIAPPAATLPLIPLAWLLVHRLEGEVTTRSTIQLGAVFGLLGIIGAPWAILAVGAGCIVLSAGRRDRRFYAAAAIAVLIGVVVASPSLLSFHDISPQVERSGTAFSPQTVFAASLSWARLAEMVIGPWRGLPTDLGPSGFAASNPGVKWPPFFLSVFIGPLLIPALFISARGRVARHRILFIFFLFVAIGPSNPLLRWVIESFESTRIMRYPEKFAVPMTVSGIVLVMAYLARPNGARWTRRAELAVIGLLVLAGITAIVSPSVSPPNRARLVVGCIVATSILVCAALRDRIPRGETLAIGLSFALLVYWAVRVLPIDELDGYRTPSAVAEEAEGARVYREPLSNVSQSLSSARDRYRIAARALDPVFGVTHGVSYVLDRSPDGLYSLLTRVASERFAAVDLERKLRYLRIAGCRFWITQSRIEHRGLALRGSYDFGPAEIHVYEVLDPLPMVSAPSRSEPGRSLQDVVRLIEGSGFDERTTVVTPGNREARDLPWVIVSDVEQTTQSIRFRVSAASESIVVLNQSYFDAWDVRANGDPVSIFPANLDRLGVEVPEGDSTIEARFGRRPLTIVFVWALSWLILIAIGIMSLREQIRDNPKPAAS